MRSIISFLTASEASVVVAASIIYVFLLFGKGEGLREKIAAHIRKSIIFAVFLAGVVCTAGWIVGSYTCVESLPCVMTVGTVVIFCYGAFAASDLIKGQNLKRFVRRAGIICLLLFAAEVFLFQYRSYTPHPQKQELSFADVSAAEPEEVEVQPDGIVFKKDGNFEAVLPEKGITAIQMQLEGSGKTFVCEASMKDENFSEKFIVTGKKITSGAYGKCAFSFLPYGNLKAVRIAVQGIEEEVRVSSCVLYTAAPFRFSNLRFFFLLALCLLICMVVTFRFYETVYHWNSFRHNLVIMAVLGVCIVFMAAFYIPNQERIYLKTADIDNADPYVQMFDAVINGRTHLDIEPAQELLEMKNPYDASLRNVQEVYYKWDRAFYKGKYYTFWGTMPLWLFYFPYYFFSGGYLPDINMACIFFSVLSVIFLFGAVLSFTKWYIRRPNFLLLLLSLSGGVFTSGIYYLLDYSDMYTLPAIVSNCFLMLCLWMGIAGCHQKSWVRQLLLFFLCGMAFICCFEARPVKALSALLLAPLFVGVLLDKKYTLKQKIVDIVVFFIPIAAGLGAIMAFNYARFDSPFEFGSAYQLTVSDIRANKLRLCQFPFAIVHFFLQPLACTDTFPFFNLSHVGFANYGKYVYTDTSAGIISYPVLFAGLLVTPFYLFHTRRRTGEKYVYNTQKVKSYMYGAMLFLAVIVSWIDFCVGGVVIRYLADILPIVTLLVIFIVLDVQMFTVNIPAVSGKYIFAFSMLWLITILMVFVQLPVLFGAAIGKHFPGLISVLEELIFCG